MILLFNGSCGFCSALANKISSSSKIIEILPLQSERAVGLLREIYPNGFKFTFYVIDDSKSSNKSYKGIMAALKLLTILPLRVSFYVLGAFVRHEVMQRRKGTRNRFIASGDVDLERRKFAKYIVLAPLLLFLPRIPFITTSGGGGKYKYLEKELCRLKTKRGSLTPSPERLKKAIRSPIT